jgi:hypothetical protein
MMTCGKLHIVLVLVATCVGCGPDAPSVRYSGSTQAARPPEMVKVFRATTPDRPFVELGTVEVNCPTAGQARPFGQMAIEGGCGFDQAVGMAVERAAEAGADGIFSINTAAGGNGNLVSLTAVAVRFTGPPAVKTPAPAKADAAAPPAKPTVADRLRKLKELADQGLITQDEYDRRKSEILKEL